MTEIPEDDNIFSIIFEVVSAYGNNGMSMGAPGYAFSMSGVFTPLGKLAIIATMMLGKCRGLPKRNDIVIDFRFKHLRRLAGLTHKHRLRVKDAIQAVATRIPRGRGSVVAAMHMSPSRRPSQIGAGGSADSGDASSHGIGAAISRTLSLSPMAAARLFAGRNRDSSQNSVVDRAEGQAQSSALPTGIQVDRRVTTTF
jgi:hypothetical protein